MSKLSPLLQTMLSDIKNFKYVKPNIEKNKCKTPEFVITRQLFIRLHEARLSFILLVENEKFYEAAIISGHILETLGILSFIKDSDNPNYNSKIYYASSLVSEIKYFLKFKDNIDSTKGLNLINNRLSESLNLFKQTSDIIFNNKNKERKTYNKSITTLLSANTKTKTKIGELDNFYRPKSPDNYIKDFIKKYAEVFPDNKKDLNMICRLYIRYCASKHSNHFFCELSDNKKMFPKESVINGIFTVHLVFTYLKKFGYTKATV